MEETSSRYADAFIAESTTRSVSNAIRCVVNSYRKAKLHLRRKIQNDLLLLLTSFYNSFILGITISISGKVGSAQWNAWNT